MSRLYQANLEGVIRPFGFKVVTTDLHSLGLKNNPNILTYPLSEWLFLPDDQIVPGKGDYGGIGVFKRQGDARKIARHMRDTYGSTTRTFLTFIDQVLYEQDDRVKTNGVYLANEITREIIGKRCRLVLSGEIDYLEQIL